MRLHLFGKWALTEEWWFLINLNVSEHFQRPFHGWVVNYWLITQRCFSSVKRNLKRWKQDTNAVWLLKFLPGFSVNPTWKTVLHPPQQMFDAVSLIHTSVCFTSAEQTIWCVHADFIQTNRGVNTKSHGLKGNSWLGRFQWITASYWTWRVYFLSFQQENKWFWAFWV